MQRYCWENNLTNFSLEVVMSLCEKLLEAWGDAEAYRALHHEDWQMKMHSSGSTVALSDMTEC